MNKIVFKEIVKKNSPPKHRVRNSLMAFLIGGSVGVLADGIYLLAMNVLEFEKKDAMLISTMTIIFLTVIFTAFCLFSKASKYAGAGLFIPTSGFANSVVAETMDAKFEGPVYGVGSSVFKLAGSVIIYGFTSAFFYTLIRLLLSLVGVPL